MSALALRSIRSVMLLILLIAANILSVDASGQEPLNEIGPQISAADTSITDPEHIREAWQILDQARGLYLAGDLDTAYLMLQHLSTDTLIPDDLDNARRELTAYVLSGLGEHERAFDSLQLYVLTREEYLDELRSRSEADAELRIQQINERIVELEQGSRAALEQQRSELQRYLFIAGGIIVLLLIAIIAIALRPRIVVVQQPAIDAPVTLSPTPPTTPKISEVKEPIAESIVHPPIHGEPMDASIMYDHSAQISAQLNKGATVEAAGHLGILLRFLRSVNNEMVEGHLPAQEAIAFLRQYLKLEMLRTGSKVRYTVDADRRSLEQKHMVPAMALLPIMAQAARSAETSITVELISTDVGEGSHCVIKYPLRSPAPELAQSDQIKAGSGLKVEEEIQGNEMTVHVKWPEHHKGRPLI